MIKNVYWFPRKVPVILVRFQQNSNVLDWLSKNTQYVISLTLKTLN